MPPKRRPVRDRSSEGNHHGLSRLLLTTHPSPRAVYFQSQSNDLFRQPVASRIDDVSHPCVGMKPKAQVGAWEKRLRGIEVLAEFLHQMIRSGVGQMVKRNSERTLFLVGQQIGLGGKNLT